ncbi:hypothetical protein BW723_05465 [Polaribacter reichenbachii]|uniref:Outer membrane protein beta-barrel domain-containing protein n=1 Tax=Polaribacter reichenbachii TaxID=996801 RepID=A0A1B8TTV2_9FLAO|nr:hypothetical protein [Polaribacter reichenbachii]APZ45778.1 hypothetical protein BW723_05465 [Polaribacter reichenbachii]AUC19640.1 hypothetical protein BTO17_13480 [Polaribacter reichenbachii]OBY63206.1 hypothetical protein LPB301_10245 [Polaribacter reichenbachii]
MDHKNIDKLFQEQLKNLEVSPNKSTWNNIENKLKKKKRKVFPFWWFSGAAASVLILGILFNPFSKDENQNINDSFNETITTIPKENSTILKEKDTLILNKTLKNDVLISKTKKRTHINKNTQNLAEIKQNKNVINNRKPVKPLQFSYNSFDDNFKISQKNSALFLSNINTNKKRFKKLNIQDFNVEKKDLSTKKIKTKNWYLAPVFAVLQSNSFTNTSPINENLANSTKGKNTYSYGVQIAYKINKKWTIQSGIHLQEMSYANNRISISVSEQSSATTTEFTNGETFSFDGSNNFNALLSSDFTTTSKTTFGNLTQNYGYLEIPVEVKYNLSTNDKFETQIVTGFSSLFLNKNSVNLNTETISKTLEANNLNNINFSGNLGLDFNYLFDKNWSLNINPMLKMQLNTFNKNSNGFAPFNLGFYTGIQYNF